MKHVWALIIKFLMNVVVLGIIQGLMFGWPFATIIITSILLTGVAYIVGDLWILPMTTNLAASSADFGLSWIVIWAVGSLFLNEPVYTAGPLFTALIIAVGEWFFHHYVMSRILQLTTRQKSPA